VSISAADIDGLPTGASAQKEINEPTGKIVRAQGDVANIRFEPLARLGRAAVVS
jgi:hypothetical protein